MSLEFLKYVEVLISFRNKQNHKKMCAVCLLESEMQTLLLMWEQKELVNRWPQRKGMKERDIERVKALLMKTILEESKITMVAELKGKT